jgi:hypothetical protein
VKLANLEEPPISDDLDWDQQEERSWGRRAIDGAANGVCAVLAFVWYGSQWLILLCRRR